MLISESVRGRAVSLCDEDAEGLEAHCGCLLPRAAREQHATHLRYLGVR